MMKWIRARKAEFTRKLIQVITAVLYNCNFTGFMKGKIYKGPVKNVCVPGLNCYSCPGAVAACPIGSLQSGLVNYKYSFPYYVLGVLLLFGVLFGRLICGFLCPFGLLQELLHKIPLPKIKKGRWSEILSYLKYVILAVFCVFVPIVFSVPGFCKFICPAGTLEGGLPLVSTNERLLASIGSLFQWKLALLFGIVIGCIFVYRGFCRFLCPLGAFYSLFNRISFFRMHVDATKCNGCNACIKSCGTDVKCVGDRECIQCGECAKTCPKRAISRCNIRKNAEKS